MTTTRTYDPTLFEGASWYYASYRPRYPEALYKLISEAFNLNGKGRLLDLGTGIGLIAIALRHQFEEVVGLDPDPEMLQVAQQEAESAGASNIRWVNERAELISPTTLGNFRLITIGRAFHWMDRELVLQRSYELLEEEGGIAIIGSRDGGIWESSLPWKQRAIAVVKKWLGEQRRSGQGVRTSLDRNHDEFLAKSAFARTAEHEFQFEQNWTIDTFIGYLYSTAFCRRAYFGEQAEQFEADLRKALLQVEPSGQFQDRISGTVYLAWKRG